MKKQIKKSLSLGAETIRALTGAGLAGAAGGYASIPCASRGCSYASCAVSCTPTDRDCVSHGCPI